MRKAEPSGPLRRRLTGRVARRPVIVGALLAAACTYGPEEHTASVTEVLRLGDTFRAIVVIRHDSFRRPTGLSAFPDGGKWRYLERGSAQYLVDARSRDLTLLAEQAASAQVWEAYDARIVGLQDDSVAYVSLTGCPRGGECYPALQRSMMYRLSIRGDLSPAGSMPGDAGLPGEMAARRPGEQNYVRFNMRGDTITARFEEGEQPEPLFFVRSDGSLHVVVAG